MFAQRIFPIDCVIAECVGVCASALICIRHTCVWVCAYTYATMLAGKHVSVSHCGHTKVNSSTQIFVEGSLFALAQFPRVRYLSEKQREQC